MPHPTRQRSGAALIRLTVRLTPAERKAIRGKARKYKLSEADYLRRCALGDGRQTSLKLGK